MKVVVVFLLLCVAVLNVDAQCSTSACVRGSPVTEDNRCELYRNYYDCLVNERDKCTVATTKSLFQQEVDRNVALRRGIKCGAAGITVSLFTLILALFAASRQL